MNKEILNIDIQYFIENNIDSNITSLLLKGCAFPLVDTKEIIEQIEAKKKCKYKLPKWFQTENIYYPNKINIEQTSSEVTAKYKASLVEGNSIIDITGGFGVDCYYFSKQFKTVTHCELDSNLSRIVKYNYKQLGILNIDVQHTDGITVLSNNSKQFDWVYADPSRRHDSKGKVFFLNDCLPNIPEHLDSIFKYSKNLMIKTSPLLDLSVGINELNFVKTIYVIALNNEAKELLWVLEKGYKNKVTVKTVNITKGSYQIFNFFLEDEKKFEPQYSNPLTYLYESNTAILKAGAFNAVAKSFNIFKLQKHSHLYTSIELIDFPGRQFKIEKTIPYHVKTIKKLGLKKANITTRNFPETVSQIRKKLEIKDGGNAYLFFTTDYNLNKIVIITSKV